MTEPTPPDASIRLAEERTALSFERTRLSADRTMMATLRTSFSMIGFGFTLFSFFRSLAAKDLLGEAVPERAPALFGLTLVVFGLLVLANGLFGDRAFRRWLHARRQALTREGLMPAEPPPSRPAVRLAAFLLLLLGLVTILGMAARIGPFA
ncbi:MAG: DUF202 domain-containing protein [Sphingomonadaceae bacterium]|uniref:YidH family protein n=1 Tax=Thermaurantiacus sp. TaxID=2820283 RepID=UPI00298F08F1|nr:DUF202 domain-containing protein [Thermaurantiacus sp.]MCS6986123.1 DUF202 domain-containing protein [Sphingomonadaceae bacterium]MDW8414653.1 DUF202 domain-containing protein [Thermaurantiacus sp.]